MRQDTEFAEGQIVWIVSPDGTYLDHGPYPIVSYLGTCEWGLEIYLLQDQTGGYFGTDQVTIVSDRDYQAWHLLNAN